MNAIKFLAAAYIVCGVYQLYLNQMLQIRWRRWLTDRYLGEWIGGRIYYRMQLTDRGTDNPDQRIAEDLALFVDKTLSLTLGLLSAVVTLVSFVAILWSLGALGWADFRLNLFLNVISPLTMVMGFADSMQMTFAIRDRMLAGDDRFEATKYAVRVVGPACFLNGATAALSFIALTFSDSALIQTFANWRSPAAAGISN